MTQTTEYQFNDIEQFSQTNAALDRMQKYFKTVPDCTDKHGYEFTRIACGLLQKTRKAVDDARTEKTAYYRDQTKLINGEGKRIIEIIEKIEGPYRSAKKRQDEIEERLKEERLARLDAKVQGIRDFVGEAKGKPAAEISIVIDLVTNIETANDFYDRTKEATAARQETLDELTQMLQDRIAFETAEQEKIKAEEESNRLKLAAQIQTNISNIQTIPNNLFGATCEAIQRAIDETQEMSITNEKYGERAEEAREIVSTVLTQLNQMMTMAKTVEDAEKIKADDAARVAAEEAQKETELEGAAESHATEDIPLESYETESDALAIDEHAEKPAISEGGHQIGLNNPDEVVLSERQKEDDKIYLLEIHSRLTDFCSIVGDTPAATLNGQLAQANLCEGLKNVLADLNHNANNL